LREKGEVSALKALLHERTLHFPTQTSFVHVYQSFFLFIMVDSKFSQGLLAADDESLRTQVALWDDMKLWGMLWKKVRGSISDEDLVQEKLNEKAEWLSQFGDNEIRLMLLTRITDHLDLELPKDATAGELDDLGSEIEAQSIQILKENDDDFDGSTTSEMAQHVMQGLFEELTDRFEDQDQETQEKVVSAILEEIESMPEAQRERLREALDADELSRESIRKAIASGSLGTAFAAVVQVAGFSAYMAAVNALAAVTGVLGLTIPFGVYTTLTSAVAVAANPWVLVPVLLGGGWYLTSHTNEKMRNNLLPVVVTQCTVQAAMEEYSNDDLSNFISEYNNEINRYLEAKENGDYESAGPLEDKYKGISAVNA
jgi:hypothetical protein